MKRSSSILLSLLLVFCLMGSFFALDSIERVFPSSSMEDVLFISSPEFVKRASLGYSGLLADIYWMRVVQYFGSKHMQDSKQYRALAPLLDITTTLDPHLMVAYEWGSTFLQQPPPSGAGDTDAAIALIHKGIAANPNHWQLYRDLGFIHYLGRHDYVAAAKAFEDGSRVPNANPSMKVMAAKMLTDAGSTETARYIWESIYEDATDKDIKRNAGIHLACLLVDEEIPKLESAAGDFRSRFGRYPTGWREMAIAGMIRTVPRDPLGQPYVLGSNGKVFVSDVKALPFIHVGKPA